MHDDTNVLERPESRVSRALLTVLFRSINDGSTSEFKAERRYLICVLCLPQTLSTHHGITVTYNLVLNAVICLSPLPSHAEVHPPPHQVPTNDNEISDNISIMSETVYEPDNIILSILTPHSTNQGDLSRELQPPLPYGLLPRGVVTI